MSRATLSIVVGLAIVNAGPGLARSQPLSMAGLIERLLAEGEDIPLGRNIGKDLGFPNGAATKAKEFFSEEGMRGQICNLVVDRTGDEALRPVTLVLLDQRLRGRDVESHFFRLNLDGSLERAFLSRGKTDAQGNPIRGSGVITPLDIKSRKVKARLKRELDFWLSGKHFKQEAAQPVPASAAGSSSVEKPR